MGVIRVGFQCLSFCNHGWTIRRLDELPQHIAISQSPNPINVGILPHGFVVVEARSRLENPLLCAIA
jgi:hypothetical protein